MQTREERAQELADKKQKENSQIEQIQNVLNTFLSDFKATNIKLEHSYSLKDEVSLKQLNNAINSIPKEFKINHTTDKVSNKFLWWYFAVSTFFLSLAIGYGINQHYKYSDIEKVKENAFIQGQKKGYQDIYQIVPKNTQQFLQKKHPNIFKN